MLKFKTKNRQDTCYQAKGEKSMFEQIFTIFDKNLHNEEIMQGSKPPFQKGSTLAEGATHVAMSNNSRKFGFTLAEVLITLAVIGVVAAITMPMLITNVRNQVRAKRIENIEQKFSKATDKMVALGVYNGHASTQEFVNELGKHLKLTKVCDNDNLQSCWPYEKVILVNGEEWDIRDTKTYLSLKLRNGNNNAWDKTMGIVTADGVSMILSYNKNCDIDDTKPISYPPGGAISTTTGCIAGVFDWNGAKNPNKYNEDVIAFNAGGLGSSCAVELGNSCFTAPILVPPVTKARCLKLQEKYDIKTCELDRSTATSLDYWAAAVEYCGGIDKLPTFGQLSEIAKDIYGTEISGTKQTGLTYNENSQIAKALGLKPTFYIWSNQQNADSICTRYYSKTETGYSNYYGSCSAYPWYTNGGRGTAGVYTMCVGD